MNLKHLIQNQSKSWFLVFLIGFKNAVKQLWKQQSE